MVTSAPCSHRSAQMSCAELFDPTTTHFFPANASPPGCWLEWCCTPLNAFAPGKPGMSGTPDIPVARISCLGRSVTALPSRSMLTVHSPIALSYQPLLHSDECQ